MISFDNLEKARPLAKQLAREQDRLVAELKVPGVEA